MVVMSFWWEFYRLVICFLLLKGAIQELKLYNNPTLAEVQCEDFDDAMVSNYNYSSQTSPGGLLTQHMYINNIADTESDREGLETGLDRKKCGPYIEKNQKN